MAPANFGTLSGALLIGNFGDGKINGFNATTGALIHALGDASGNPIVNSGLWGLWFGNGGRNQPVNTLYLSAGLNGEINGLYARIDLGATAPDIAAPTGVAITAPTAAATVSGTVTVNANATDNVGVARVVFSVRVGTTTTEIATDTTAPFSASWNTGAVANGAATLTAAAFDAFGNSTTSPAIAVTVNNVPDVTPPRGGRHLAALRQCQRHGDRHRAGHRQCRCVAGGVLCGCHFARCGYHVTVFGAVEHGDVHRRAAVDGRGARWRGEYDHQHGAAGDGRERTDPGAAADRHLRAAVLGLSHGWAVRPCRPA